LQSFLDPSKGNDARRCVLDQTPLDRVASASVRKAKNLGGPR
jgi:hypothetical protein